MKRITALFITLFVIIIGAKADRAGFVYKNFHVDAVVSASNEWNVTETIDVEFFEPRHGIYRYIPMGYSLKHNLKLDDGTENLVTMAYRPKIEDIEVPNEKVDISVNDGNKIIRIGDSDREIKGLHRYVIKYRFCYPSDRITDKDYIFHTILGTDFAEDIEKFSFNIQFEKPYADYATGEWEIYSGNYGSAGSSIDADIKYTENSISGTASNIPPYHGLTLHLNLKEGYYEGIEEASPLLMNICLLISLLLAVYIAVKLFNSKDADVVKSIEFYPPDGISSAEVGTIIDGNVDNIDIASLIPWFASKGYLTIREVEESGIFSKKIKLEISKADPLPSDAPPYQDTFYKLLFDGGSTVRLDKIGEHPSGIASVTRQINNLYKGKEGDQNDRSLTHVSGDVFWYLLFAISTSFALWFSYTVNRFDWGEMIPIGIFWVLPLFLNLFINISSASRKYTDGVLKKVFIFAITLEEAGLIFLLMTDIMSDESSMMNIPTILAVFIVGFLLTTFAGRFEISTPYRAQMMGKLLGLKEFIETAEKPRLELMLQDDPQYFYRILPYALVFGISDKWAEQFKGITMENPTWYESASAYNAHMFASSMTSNLCSSVESAITTISHDSSSSSSGGGGFSGGGGGGGGGGSW